MFVCEEMKKTDAPSAAAFKAWCKEMAETTWSELDEAGTGGADVPEVPAPGSDEAPNTTETLTMLYKNAMDSLKKHTETFESIKDPKISMETRTNLLTQGLDSLTEFKRAEDAYRTALINYPPLPLPPFLTTGAGANPTASLQTAAGGAIGLGQDSMMRNSGEGGTADTVVTVVSVQQQAALGGSVKKKRKQGEGGTADPVVPSVPVQQQAALGGCAKKRRNMKEGVRTGKAAHGMKTFFEAILQQKYGKDLPQRKKGSLWAGYQRNFLDFFKDKLLKSAISNQLTWRDVFYQAMTGPVKGQLLEYIHVLEKKNKTEKKEEYTSKEWSDRLTNGAEGLVQAMLLHETDIQPKSTSFDWEIGLMCKVFQENDIKCLSTAIKHPVEVSKDVIEIMSTDDEATESDDPYKTDDWEQLGDLDFEDDPPRL